jgi:hypothetical protein
MTYLSHSETGQCEEEAVIGMDVRSRGRRISDAARGVGGDKEMDIQRGERVLVNLAPFIGAARRSNESIPCNVLKIDGTLVEVETEEPTYRRFSLWVASSWIDGKAGPSEPHFMRQLLSGASRDMV